jgi:hypothetical protein
MEPLIPSTARDAFRKKMALNHGTEKETTARRMVARRVTRNPGVAGFIGEGQKKIFSKKFLYDD